MSIALSVRETAQLVLGRGDAQPAVRPGGGDRVGLSTHLLHGAQRSTGHEPTQGARDGQRDRLAYGQEAHQEQQSVATVGHGGAHDHHRGSSAERDRYGEQPHDAVETGDGALEQRRCTDCGQGGGVEQRVRCRGEAGLQDRAVRGHDLAQVLPLLDQDGVRRRRLEHRRSGILQHRGGPEPQAGVQLVEQRRGHAEVHPHPDRAEEHGHGRGEGQRETPPNG
ncbi:MAG: hypothetical protein ACR2KL_14125 [Nocardioidaceae bacterium]